MKKLLFFLPLLVTLSSVSQDIHVNRTNPVSRNFSFTDDVTGILKIKTIFNISKDSQDSVKVSSIKYSGTIKWVGNRPDDAIKGALEQSTQSDYLANIKDGNGSEILRTLYLSRPWDNITITVSYQLNGITYTLPSEVIYSRAAQQARDTKIEINPAGIVSSSRIGNIKIKVGSVASVTFDRVEAYSDGNLTSTILNASRISGPNLGFYDISFDLPNSAARTYKIKLFAVTTGESSVALPAIEKDVTFQKEIAITTIAGKTDISAGYNFILTDESSEHFLIHTIGDAGKFQIDNNLTNYQISLIENSPSNGIYDLIIKNTKLIFGDEQNLTFRINGIKVNGDFRIIRPYPEIEIGAEQKTLNSIKFNVILPDWITGDLQLELENNTRITIPNSAAINVNKSKKFEKEIPGSKFNFNVDKDSLITSTIKVMLEDKPLLTAQYKFINLNYYQKRINDIQKKDISKSDKKEELMIAVSSLFEATQGSYNIGNIKEVAGQLASNNDSDKNTGWQSLAAMAIKFAPALLAIL
jgi:hypothetical protein